MNLYLLKHKKYVKSFNNEPIYDTKHIGYFLSYEKARKVEKKYKQITGFKDFPNNFIIESIEIDEELKDIGIKYDNKINSNTLYILWNEYYVKRYNFDNITRLGIYSTLKNAKSAKSFFKHSEQYCKNKNKFNIGSFVINEEYWKEGFTPNKD